VCAVLLSLSSSPILYLSIIFLCRLFLTHPPFLSSPPLTYSSFLWHGGVPHIYFTPQDVEEGATLLLPRLTACVDANGTSAFVALTSARLMARRLASHISPPYGLARCKFFSRQRVGRLRHHHSHTALRHRHNRRKMIRGRGGRGGRGGYGTDRGGRAGFGSDRGAVGGGRGALGPERFTDGPSTHTRDEADVQPRHLWPTACPRMTVSLAISSTPSHPGKS
jgi:hypothetical protein